MRLRDAMNEPLQAQASKVVGQLGSGVRATEQRFDRGAKVAVPKAVREMGEGAEGLEERHGSGLTGPQR